MRGACSRFRLMKRSLVLLLSVFAALPREAAAVDLAPTERIVFESIRDGDQTDLYAVAAGGSQIRNLTRTPDLDEYNVRASRDGRMLAFARGPAGGSGEGDDVFVMRNDGTGLRRVTQTENASEFRPTFSPDASSLAYTTESVTTGDIDIVVMDLGTGVARRITSGGINSLPDWSPDGRRFAYTRCVEPLTADDGHSCAIWVMGVDGRDPVQLTDVAPWLLSDSSNPGNNGDLFPAWSPDGGTIAFTRMIGGTLRTYLMDADGNNERPLLKLNGPANDWVPAWSQDGSRLAFFRLPAVGVPAAGQAAAPGIYLATADGEETTRLTSPDGLYEDFGVAFAAAAADPPAVPEPPGAPRTPASPPAAPEVVIASSKVGMSRRGEVTIALRCLAASVCRGRVELLQGRRNLAERPFAVARELPVRIRMRLPADVRSRVARRGSVRLVARAVAPEAGTASRTIRVARGWKAGRR